MSVTKGAATAARPAGGEEPRTYLGSVLRITVDFLRARDHLPAIRQKVSAATAALIDKPPFPFAWIPCSAMDELESALLAVAGPQACADLGATAARNLGGSVIAPVLKMASALFGNTPQTLYQNLDRFYPMVLKGMRFSYEALGDREGLVLASAGGPGVPAALFHVTRGNLTYIFELCGVSGTVDGPQDIRCDSQGGEARYRVRWS